jgi:hypothetical protein
MTERDAAEKVSHFEQQTLGFPLGAWVGANALGLGLTFALFALVGGTIEAMGADHDSAARNLPAIVAMLAGGTVFALLRRRVLGVGPGWHAPAVGAGLTTGFLVGSVAPFDFLLAILAAGTIGGILQLRAHRRQPGDYRRLLLVGTATWLVASLAAIAAAILVADVVLAGVFGVGDSLDGVAGFTAVVTLVGIVGGIVGGAIEGAILLHRMGRPT